MLLRPLFHIFRHAPRVSALALALVTLVLATACGGTSPRTSAPAAPAGATARAALSYGQQRRFDELFLEAMCRKQKGEHDAEHELLSAALRINPDAPEALYELALLELARPAEADSLHLRRCDSLLRRAVALDPTNKFYKSTLANFYINEADYAPAIRIVEEMARREPSTELLSMLVSLYETTDDYNGAIRALNRLEKLEGKNETYSLEKFKIYLRMKDDANAYATIEELCAEYPYDLRYRVLLGDLYEENGHDTMALAVYRDVLAAEPHNSYAQLSLLSFYQKKGPDSLYNAYADALATDSATDGRVRFEVLRALAAAQQAGHTDSLRVLGLFRRALDLPQADRSVAELCALYMSAIGLPTDSLERPMRAILAVEPDYDRARLQLLQLLVSRDSMQAAVDLCHEGRLYSPTQLVYYYYEGLCLYRLDRPADALRVLEGGTARIDASADSELASDLYATLGDLYYEDGRHEQAYAAYDSALVYNPDNYLCMNNYAYFLSLRGERLDRAEELARKAVGSAPDDPTFLDTYAWVLFVKGQYTQARIYIDQTLRHAGDEPDANLLEHAGDIYFKCGEREAALGFWRRALKAGPDADRRAVLERKVARRTYVAG